MAIQTLTRNTMTELLRQDHRRMTRLFDRIEGAEGARREVLTQEALKLIRTHDVIERSLLYPAAAKEPGISRRLVLDCEEAHHVVRLIMAELKVRPYSERYFAKFSTLAEAIREHIADEENELFPAIEASGIDNESLAAEMMKLRQEVESKGGFFKAVASGGGKLAGAAVAAGVVWAAYKAFTSKK